MRVPERGQAIVEFALVLPILLLLLLGTVDLAFLMSRQQGYQRAANVLADVAAERMRTMPGESWQGGWEQLVQQEAGRFDCTSPTVDVSFPDVTHNPGDRVVVDWRCQYVPLTPVGLTLWPGGLSVHVTSASVIRS